MQAKERRADQPPARRFHFMLTAEQFVCYSPPQLQYVRVQPQSGELGLGQFSTWMLKLAGILAIGAVGMAAPFIIHAAITEKPGTIWAERAERRRRA